MGTHTFFLKSVICVGVFAATSFSQINISVDANAGIKKISPYILWYGLTWTKKEKTNKLI